MKTVFLGFLLGDDESRTLTIAILYLKPKSRGSIRIQSKDPLQIVLADEGFLENEEDLESVKQIYREYIKPIAIELEAIDPSYRLLSPTMDVIDNDEELDNFIKDNFEHNNHQQGSLRMAPLELFSTAKLGLAKRVTRTVHFSTSNIDCTRIEKGGFIWQRKYA